jgi:hypothetical protein
MYVTEMVQCPVLNPIGEWQDLVDSIARTNIDTKRSIEQKSPTVIQCCNNPRANHKFQCTLYFRFRYIIQSFRYHLISIIGYNNNTQCRC